MAGERNMHDPTEAEAHFEGKSLQGRTEVDRSTKVL